MEKRGYRRVVLTLAISLFVLCATNQCSATLSSGLEQALVFLVFAALILFVVNRSSVLYEAIVQYAIGVVEIVVIDAPHRFFAGQFSTIDALVDEPFLPSRFQRPPPLLSV